MLYGTSQTTWPLCLTTKPVNRIDLAHNACSRALVDVGQIPVLVVDLQYLLSKLLRGDYQKPLLVSAMLKTSEGSRQPYACRQVDLHAVAACGSHLGCAQVNPPPPKSFEADLNSGLPDEPEEVVVGLEEDIF